MSFRFFNIQVIKVLSGFIVLFSITWFVMEAEGPHSRSVEALSNRERKSEPNHSIDLKYDWQIGKKYSYRFENNLQIIHNEQEMRYNYNGQVMVDVLDLNENVYDLIISFEFDNEIGHLNLDPDSELRLAARISTNGGIIQTNHLATSGPVFTNLSTDILTNLLKRVPDNPSQLIEKQPKVWETLLGYSGNLTYQIKSKDARGYYVANVVMNESNATRYELNYNKQRYIDSSTDIKVVASDSVVNWDREKSLPETVTGVEKIEINFFNNFIRSHSEYNFEMIEISGTDGGSLSDYSQVVAIYEKEPTNIGSNPYAHYRAADWDELQDELTMLTPQTPRSDVLTVSERMALSFKANPELVNHLKIDEEFYSVEEPQFAVVLGALSFSGSAEAQLALKKVYGLKSQTDEGRLSVLRAFALTDEVLTENSVNTLHEIYNDSDSTTKEKDTSALALAAAAKNEPNTESEDIIKALWFDGRLQKDKVMALAMIGNTGDIQYMPISLAAFKEKGLQAAALDSMRFMHESSAQEFILSKLDTMEPEQVKMAAADAISYQSWQDEYQKPLATCVSDSRNSDEVRMACARVVMKEKSQREDMRTLLTKISQEQSISDTLTTFISNQLQYAKLTD